VTLVSGIHPSAAPAGGTRSYVLGLAERLRGRNVSVALVARNGAASPLDGVEYVRIRSPASSVRFLFRLSMSAPFLPIPKDSIIHAQRPDDLVAFALAKRGNPKVCTLHGVPPMAIRRRRGAVYGALYEMLERIGLRRTDRVIAVDAGTAKWYADRYPWLASRTSVIPVAVDTARFRPTDREAARASFGVRASRALVYAGRLTVEKRVGEAIRAVRELRDCELLIAGEGRAEADLRELARGAPVRFLGPVAHDDMPRLLNAADVLVLPSEYEGMPTVVLEALACGVPVAATPVGGIPEVVVPGRTGWLFREPDDLVRVLREALPRASEMRAACVDAARPYGWDAIVDRILALYREAAA